MQLRRASGSGRYRAGHALTGNPVAATYTYDPYGLITATTGAGLAATSNPIRQAAGIQDPLTGWNRHGTRYHDTTTGRWTTTDPTTRLNDPNQANPYVYANCNAINYTDPTGKYSVQECGRTIFSSSVGDGFAGFVLGFAEGPFAPLSSTAGGHGGAPCGRTCWHRGVPRVLPIRFVGTVRRNAMASQSDELSTRADMAGEKPIESFKASRGPYYGFNGVYVYLVTDKSLWQSRSRAFELFGGPRRIERWPIGECGARAMKDAVIELQTPERRVKLKLDANQSAEEIVRAFQAHHS